VEYKHVRLWIAVASLCLIRAAAAQFSEADPVRGEVHGYGSAQRVTVTLTEVQGERVVSLTDLRGDGSFEFRHVPYGEYRLLISTPGGRPIHEQMLSIRSAFAQPILVEVAQHDDPRPPSGAVSAAELLHPPAKKALQETAQAQRFSATGEHEKAAEELEKAVQLSPDYAAAWINLAAQHLALKRYREALDELERAGRLAPPTALLYANLAYAQFGLGQNEDAVRSARLALKIDPSYAPAHYLLGSFLALDRRTVAEGVQHLEIAARTMPGARTNLEHARHDLSQLVAHP
jgi:tetratricopeptide (TPR) repeat protein